ncbi:nucleoside recognition domain-containing protein [Halomonas campaniensis]|uniref:Membrane protein n=1 Tax=Halomonas campaniensis TaxID=213554 RepID=A0A2D0AXV6_9GAMM|nr:nucleoside recognition domain-containing protein [Halomonas campaniensis]OWV28009.1 membrane protein [Halomonas campaniensis]
MRKSIYHLSDGLYSVLKDALRVYMTLLKILIPALLIVKGLEWLGIVGGLGAVLAPLMSLLGLPEQLGVVWAAALFTNLYTAIAVFFQVAGDMPLSVEQVTVLGALMLVGHSIPVEGAVAKRAGAPWWATIVLRVGGALLFAWLLHCFYSTFGLLQAPVELIWQPSFSSEPTLSGWAVAQLETLALIFVIIFALIVLLKLLQKLGLERWIHLVLRPLLKLLGIGRSAANVTVIGFTLGLSYGAGLLIRDVQNGVLSKRDSTLALCFLGLCHSVIEDTLLILMLGADIAGILWARLLFAVIVTAIIARWPKAVVNNN